MAEPTIEQIQAALRNAVERGAPEAHRAALVQMLKQANAREDYRYRISEGEKQVAEKMGLGDRLLSGIGRGMQNVYLNAREMGSHAFEPETAAKVRPTPDEWAQFRQGEGPLLETGAGAVGNIIGETAATAPLGAGSAKLAQLAGKGLVGMGLKRTGGALASRLMQNVAASALPGALLAGPGNRAAGAGEAMAMGAGLDLLGRGVGGLARGYMRPTKQARYLASHGVENLTPGQVSPRSSLGQFEEAASTVAPFGPLVGKARQIPKGEAQFAVARLARPPGSPLKITDTRTDIQTYRDLIKEDFNRAYSEFHGKPVVGAIEPNDLGKALGVDLTKKMPQRLIGRRMPIEDAYGKGGQLYRLDAAAEGVILRTAADVGADIQTNPAVRDVLVKVDQELRNLHAGSGRDMTTTLPLFDSRDVIMARSRIRDELRSAIRQDDTVKAGLYKQADNFFTYLLERDLPNARGALRATDHAYRRWHVLDDAVERSRESDIGFTGSQLIASAKKAGLRHDDEMYKLGAAMKRTFEDKMPMTGVRWWMGPLALVETPFSLTPGSRAFVTGTSKPQLAAQRLGLGIQRLAGPKGRAIARTMRPGMYGGLAGSLVEPMSDERQRQQIREIERALREENE